MYPSPCNNFTIINTIVLYNKLTQLARLSTISDHIRLVRSSLTIARSSPSLTVRWLVFAVSCGSTKSTCSGAIDHHIFFMFTCATITTPSPRCTIRTQVLARFWCYYKTINRIRDVRRLKSKIIKYQHAGWQKTEERGSPAPTKWVILCEVWANIKKKFKTIKTLFRKLVVCWYSVLLLGIRVLVLFISLDLGCDSSVHRPVLLMVNCYTVNLLSLTTTGMGCLNWPIPMAQ